MTPKDDSFPLRPVPLKLSGIDLDHYHVAKMEHVEHTYRLYDYRDTNAKGVFRGPELHLAVESIPKADEWARFAGLLIYNRPAYESELRSWKQYWDWRKHRNEARYRSQEAGEIDYDAKNIMHCLRLLWSGASILENGKNF